MKNGLNSYNMREADRCYNWFKGKVKKHKFIQSKDTELQIEVIFPQEEGSPLELYRTRQSCILIMLNVTLPEPCVPRKHQWLRNFPNSLLSEIPSPFFVSGKNHLSPNDSLTVHSLMTPVGFTGASLVYLWQDQTQTFPLLPEFTGKAKHRSSNSRLFVIWMINWD